MFFSNSFDCTPRLFFFQKRKVSLSRNKPLHILPKAPLKSLTAMSKGGEQNVEEDFTLNHRTSTISQKESDQSGDGTGVKDTPSSSLTPKTFWRDKKFWIQIALLGIIQLYVFSLI